MSERKALLFILFVICYCLYSVQMWFMAKNVNVKQEETVNTIVKSIPVVKPNITRPKNVIKPKVIPLFMKNECSVLEIFIKKPDIKRSKLYKASNMEETNTITVIGITVFLFILVLNALLDVLKVREEEKAKKKLNPDGERRQSLAEFANKKMLRRESSKFGTQLFQIAESFAEPVEEKKSQKENKPYMRGDSINSYLSEKSTKTQADSSAPASIGETPMEPKLVKRQSVAKIIGARPASMVRRSSFPALPINPEIHALMMGNRQSSIDSDDESEGRGRRVRLIRRY